MNILGISCYFHDAATALLRDGVLVAAAEEERFTRKKHDFDFPQNAIDFCLRASGLTAGDIDHSDSWHPDADGYRLIARAAAEAVNKVSIATQATLRVKALPPEAQRRK